MLLTAAELRGIEAGEITVLFRRWRRPTVKAGGTRITRIGVLAIDAVDVIAPASISDADARHSGHPDAAAVRALLAGRDGTTYRIALRLAGPDPRIALREDTDLDLAAMRRRVARIADGEAILALIAEHPGVRAADLAERLGRERLPFKATVRRLKALGLTESLPVGYRLSPRGEAYRTRR